LRKLYLQTYASALPVNSPSNADPALMPGTQAISKSTHFGLLCGVDCSDQLNTGIPNGSEDDFDQESKTTDWWGYTWPRPYILDQVIYETGSIFPDGGWYASDLRVQVRQNFQWIDLTGITVSPAYPYSNAAGSHIRYALRFPKTSGDGVRIIGTPGGASHFTSISKLAVYYSGAIESSSGGTPGTVQYTIGCTRTMISLGRSRAIQVDSAILLPCFKNRQRCTDANATAGHALLPVWAHCDVSTYWYRSRRGNARPIPVGLDACRLWDHGADQRIGMRAYMRSTYDRRGGNQGVDVWHFLYQLSDDFNVTLDLQGPGILVFSRFNHWRGSPWRYVADGNEHLGCNRLL
jgi:hypothetical protein